MVPVCLNTLLTAEQYAYILATAAPRRCSSRRRCCPSCSRSWASCRSSSTSSSRAASRPPSRSRLRGELAFQQPRDFQAADTCADETAFWLYSSGSTGMPKGVRHVHSSPMETARLTARAVPRHARGRRHLLGRQAVLRLRPRQRHVVPDVGRRDRRAAARAADAGGGVPHAQAAPADHVLRRADALRRDAGLSAGHAREQLAAPAPVRLGRRGAAGRGRQGVHAPSSASTSSTASARPRCCTTTSATARRR